MVALPFDSAATARKARGAFFTPQPIAAFLVDWAIRRPTDTVFEPSCGEAAFVAEAIPRGCGRSARQRSAVNSYREQILTVHLSTPHEH